MRQKPPSSRQAAAFTLLEVIMVLAVIAMVVALSAAMFVASEHEDPLKGPPEDLRDMTKQASRSAVISGHSVVIAFSEKSINLTGGSGDSTSIPEGMKVKYQRWNGGRKWNDAKGLNWMFFPSGICDALRFRFEDDKQIVELAFHPLTGSITEQIVLAR